MPCGVQAARGFESSWVINSEGRRGNFFKVLPHSRGKEKKDFTCVCFSLIAFCSKQSLCQSGIFGGRGVYSAVLGKPFRALMVLDDRRVGT